MTSKLPISNYIFTWNFISKNSSNRQKGVPISPLHMTRAVNQQKTVYRKTHRGASRTEVHITENRVYDEFGPASHTVIDVVMYDKTGRSHKCDSHTPAASRCSMWHRCHRLDKWWWINVVWAERTMSPLNSQSVRSINLNLTEAGKRKRAYNIIQQVGNKSIRRSQALIR